MASRPQSRSGRQGGEPARRRVPSVLTSVAVARTREPCPSWNSRVAKSQRPCWSCDLSRMASQAPGAGSGLDAHGHLASTQANAIDGLWQQTRSRSEIRAASTMEPVVRRALPPGPLAQSARAATDGPSRSRGPSPPGMTTSLHASQRQKQQDLAKNQRIQNILLPQC